MHWVGNNMLDILSEVSYRIRNLEIVYPDAEYNC